MAVHSHGGARLVLSQGGPSLDVERTERSAGGGDVVAAWQGPWPGSEFDDEWDEEYEEAWDDGLDDEADDQEADGGVTGPWGLPAGVRAGEVLDAPTAVALAVAELAASSVTGAARVLASAPEPDVDALARARLLAALERLWGLGWEPADVVRWARRRPGGDRTPLVSLALGACLAQRPAVDLPPRWRQQAAACDVALREAEGGFLREAGAGQRSLGWGRFWVPVWAEVAAEALDVAVGLERQGAMPSVGPVAGTSGGTGGGGAQDGGADARLLDTVRKMLALAESTTFPAEAESFTAAAQKLISRHSLQAALAAGVPGAGGSGVGGAGGSPSGVRVGVDAPYEGQKAALLAAVARANRCSAVWMRHLGCSTVVGFGADLAAVEVLFASLLTQAVRGMTAAGADARPGAHTRRPEFRRAYLESFARRIGQRLDEADKEVSSSSGVDEGRLLPVLAARAAAVDDAVADAFPDLVSRRGPRSLDGAGWASGWAAAELASLDVGHAVTGRAALPSAEPA